MIDLSWLSSQFFIFHPNIKMSLKLLCCVYIFCVFDCFSHTVRSRIYTNENGTLELQPDTNISKQELEFLLNDLKTIKNVSENTQIFVKGLTTTSTTSTTSTTTENPKQTQNIHNQHKPKVILKRRAKDEISTRTTTTVEPDIEIFEPRSTPAVEVWDKDQAGITDDNQDIQGIEETPEPDIITADDIFEIPLSTLDSENVTVEGNMTVGDEPLAGRGVWGGLNHLFDCVRYFSLQDGVMHCLKQRFSAMFFDYFRSNEDSDDFFRYLLSNETMKRELEDDEDDDDDDIGSEVKRFYRGKYLLRRFLLPLLVILIIKYLLFLPVLVLTGLMFKSFWFSVLTTGAAAFYTFLKKSNEVIVYKQPNKVFGQVQGGGIEVNSVPGTGYWGQLPIAWSNANREDTLRGNEHFYM